MQKCKRETNRKYVPLVRLQVVKEKEIPYTFGEMDSPEKLASTLGPLIQDADRECVAVCCVDSRLRPTSIEIVAMGAVDECHVSMRELFKHAVLSNAVRLFVAHNHPSGNAEPSDEDKEITKEIKKAGELMGIPLLDHVIVGDNGYFSFRDNHLL